MHFTVAPTRTGPKLRRPSLAAIEPGSGTSELNLLRITELANRAFGT